MNTPKYIEDLEKRFDEKFCRVSQGGESKGKHMDKWFFPEHITPREVKEFFRTELEALIDRAVSDIEKAKTDYVGAPDGMMFEQNVKNEALDIAIEILKKL